MFYWHYMPRRRPYDDLDAARSDMFVSAPRRTAAITLGWSASVRHRGHLPAADAGEATRYPADKTGGTHVAGDAAPGIIQDGKQELSIPDGYTASTFHRYRQRVIDCILELR